MKRSLKLQRPLAVLDLETTGTVPELDRIVEIAILKIYPDGRQIKYCERVNPGIPIPPEATEVHHITDEHVKKCPPFRKLAAEIIHLLGGCDLVGFNLIRFDLPFLLNEFVRANVEFSLKGRRIVDACQIFHRKEPRDLVAALKFFCNEEYSQAHSALADAQACWKVLEAQLSRYLDLPLDLDSLHGFCNQREERFVDTDRKFEWRRNEATFTFGKYRGRSLKEIAKEEPSFLEWMLTRDFGPETKAIVLAALKGKFPKQSVRAN